MGDGEKLLIHLNSALKVLLGLDIFPRVPKKKLNFVDQCNNLRCTPRISKQCNDSQHPVSMSLQACMRHIFLPSHHLSLDLSIILGAEYKSRPFTLSLIQPPVTSALFWTSPPNNVLPLKLETKFFTHTNLHYIFGFFVLIFTSVVNRREDRGFWLDGSKHSSNLNCPEFICGYIFY